MSQSLAGRPNGSNLTHVKDCPNLILISLGKTQVWQRCPWQLAVWSSSLINLSMPEIHGQYYIAQKEADNHCYIALRYGVALPHEHNGVDDAYLRALPPFQR
jgi:hypothetical protein